MKQLILLLIPVLLIFQVANAQVDYEMRKAVDFFNSNRTHGSNWQQGLTEINIEGSPYLNSDFTEGSLFTTSKTKYVDIPLRYNIYSDQIEFKTESGQVLELSAPEVIEKVEMGDYLLEYIPYSISKKVRRGFFIVIEKGQATLYSRPRILFIDPVKPAAYQDAKPAKFIRKSDEYFIRMGMEPAVQVSKTKDLEEIFSRDNKEINSFIKKNKIKPGKAESLRELVIHYNSL